ncbi:hypothetical protein Daus18300_005917 [Diaporthe australafricana]|uniref:Uncharacterized protein n=1 Tax=Diaporthe australafricana TaxID=127596 RepID=A0ABR3WY98_9PEZI
MKLVNILPFLAAAAAIPAPEAEVPAPEVEVLARLNAEPDAEPDATTSACLPASCRSFGRARLREHTDEKEYAPVLIPSVVSGEETFCGDNPLAAEISLQS